MKVLHVTNNFPTIDYPIYGIFIKEQVNSLHKLGVNNEVFFINSRGEGRGAYLKGIFRLRRHIKGNKYDLIHCHHSLSGIILILAMRGWRLPKILSYQSEPRHEGGILLFKVLHWFFDKIILKNKPDQYSFSKVVYLPNGVDTSFFYPINREECKIRLTLDPEKRYVLFMDSYNRRKCKRIDRFYETLSILKKKFNYQNLEPLVLTNTKRELIPLYINASHLHLLTSDFEGSPNSVKECIACNIPIVSTPVGNVEEMLTGIEGAFVAKTFTSEELAVLADKALSISGYSSRDQIKKKGLSMDLVAKRLITVYSDLLPMERNKISDKTIDPQSDSSLNSIREFGSHSQSLKVLLINNCHYRRGGADVVYLNTGELLESMGNKVAYFSTHSENNSETDYAKYFVNDIDVYNVNFGKKLATIPRKLYSLEASNKLKRLLDVFKPDVAHLHLYKGGLTASILPILRKYRIPVVITLHDYSLLCPRNTFIDGDGKICEICLTHSSFNCVLKRCNRKNLYYSTITYLEYVLNNRCLKPYDSFHKIICVSKFNYEKHRSHHLFKERFLHLYNFYPALSHTSSTPIRGKYFLFYGRLVAEKGVVTLLETWRRLPEDYCLKIVGHGLLSEWITEIVKDYKLNNVEYVGFKKDAELFSYINNCSFILVPSEWYENNPLTVIEAYAAGKPVIGSNIGGIPELVVDGETGYLFNMGDIEQFEKKIRLAYLMENDEYEKMSKAAYNFASDLFSERKHYKQLMFIYNDMIDKVKSFIW